MVQETAAGEMDAMSSYDDDTTGPWDHFSEDSCLLHLCRSEFGKGSKTVHETPFVEVSV